MFIDSITREPNSVNQVKRRFEMANQMFGRVFRASSGATRQDVQCAEILGPWNLRRSAQNV